MSKKIISFAVPFQYAQKVASNNAIIEFSENNVKGYEVDQVIFSTAFNRNKCYFQVSKLLTYADKLSKLLANIDHNLAETGGKYIPAQQAGYVKIWSVENNGEFEIWGTWRATNEYFVNRRTEFNAPSIELMVDETNAIMNENGEYYEDFEWFATAQLAGIPAGSGDARNASEFREFNLDLTPRETINNNMNEEQVKALLEEQKNALTAEFKADIENIKKEFAIVGASQSQSTGSYTWTDEDGNVYQETSESIYKSVTELIEKGDLNSPIVQMMKSKGFSIVAFYEQTETDTESNDENETLETAAKQVNNALETFANAKGSESLIDQDEDATSDVTEADARMSVYKLLNNIQ